MLHLTRGKYVQDVRIAELQNEGNVFFITSSCVLELKFAICHKAGKKSVLTGFLKRCQQYWLKKK